MDYIRVQYVLIKCSWDIIINPSLNSCHTFADLYFHNQIWCDISINWSVLTDDVNLDLQGNNVNREDHPSKAKKESVCIYFQNSLPFKSLNFNYLQECINFEIRICDKTCNLISWPSWCKATFNSFASNLELKLKCSYSRKSTFDSFLGELNAETKTWYHADKTI